ncbi:MAG: oligoribonuclease [Oligoflexales bacterium]|nr:oligoribonuclease [Oligoflexales bacterium]
MNEHAEELQPILWLDLEMTGLDPMKDRILEVASLVTDQELNLLAEGPHLILQQDPNLFHSMDDWNRNHHTQSGLWQKAITSTIQLAEAEEIFLTFIKKYFPKGKGCLAGNTIWQDRRFIMQHMKRVDSYLHHRMLDISSIKILCKSWYPKYSFKKKDAHRAQDDILESLHELKFYREHIFIKKEQARGIQ